MHPRLATAAAVAAMAWSGTALADPRAAFECRERYTAAWASAETLAVVSSYDDSDDLAQDSGTAYSTANLTVFGLPVTTAERRYYADDYSIGVFLATTFRVSFAEIKAAAERTLGAACVAFVSGEDRGCRITDSPTLSHQADLTIYDDTPVEAICEYDLS